MSVRAGSSQKLSSGRAIRLPMIDEDQILNRKSATTGLFDEAFSDSARKIWPPRQNPKIAERWAGDGSPSIILIKRKHVIAACEWPEKGNGQAGDVRIALEDRACVGFFPSTFLPVVASIEDVDRAISLERIGCGDVGQLSLEPMIETHNLVPLAAIATNVERRDRFDPIRLAGASPEQQDKK